MGYRRDNINNLSKIDRVDDLIDYQDLLEVASQTQEHRSLYIEHLRVEQRRYEKRIKELTRQRSQQILLKDILTKTDNPEETLKTYRPSVFHVPKPDQSLEKFDYSKIYGPNPSFDMKSVAQEEIRDVIRAIDIAIRDIDYELSKTDLFERRTSYIIKKLQSQESSLNKAKLTSGARYKNIVQNISDINNVISKVSSLIFVLEDIPENFTTESESKKFETEFNQKTFSYNLERRALIEISEDYIEDYPEQTVATTYIIDLRVYVESLPQQLTVIMPQKEEVLKTLKVFLKRAISDKIRIKGKLEALAGEKHNAEINKRVKDLKDELNTQLATDAINDIVDKSLTQDVARQATQRLKTATDNRIRRFRERLKKANTVELINDFKYEYLNWGSLFKRTEEKDRTGDQTLEEYWREELRQKYGGDIPFCDEVRLLDGSFAKKTDVILDSESGTYIRRQDKKNQEIIDENLANDPRQRI